MQLKMQPSNSDSFQTSGLKLRSRGHSVPLIFLICLNVVTFFIMAFFNIAATTSKIGIFKNATGEISKGFEVNLTPDGKTFSVWGVIYTWQILWLIYNVVLIFIRYANDYLYKEPSVLTPVFHLFILANFLLNITWLFIWDNQKFTVSFVFLLFGTLTLYFALFISHKNVYNAELFLNKKKRYIWLYRILVNNGIAFYASWTTIATFLNLAIAITYEWAPSSEIQNFKSTSSLISLSILTVIIFIYFALDIYFLEKFLRYTYSPYVLLAVAFIGILAKNWGNGSDPAAIFTLCLCIIVPGLMFLTKIIVSIYKSKKRF